MGMTKTNLHQTIRYLERHLDLVDDDRQLGFVKQMIEQLDQQGDVFVCSSKQARFLFAIWSNVYQKESGDRPKSRIEQLREKRNKILKGGRRRASKRIRANEMEANGIGLVMKNISEGTPEARLVHDKNLRRQLTANRTLIKGTKRI